MSEERVFDARRERFGEFHAGTVDVKRQGVGSSKLSSMTVFEDVAADSGVV